MVSSKNQIKTKGGKSVAAAKFVFIKSRGPHHLGAVSYSEAFSDHLSSMIDLPKLLKKILFVLFMYIPSNHATP